MPSNHLILCCPLLLLPSIFPSIRVFSNESTLHMRWPKYWRFSLSISPSKEYPGLIFRMDWLDLLEVQGLSRVFSSTTVKKHQFFSAQLSFFFFFLTVLLFYPLFSFFVCFLFLFYFLTLQYCISFLYSPTLTSIHDHWKNHSLD